MKHDLDYFKRMKYNEMSKIFRELNIQKSYKAGTRKSILVGKGYERYEIIYPLIENGMSPEDANLIADKTTDKTDKIRDLKGKIEEIEQDNKAKTEKLTELQSIQIEKFTKEQLLSHIAQKDHLLSFNPPESALIQVTKELLQNELLKITDAEFKENPPELEPDTLLSLKNQLDLAIEQTK